MSIELKPCPFCGGEAYLRDFGAGFHRVCCWNRDCAMTCETPMRTSAEKAIMDWNTRAEKTCRVDKSAKVSRSIAAPTWDIAFSCGCELFDWPWKDIPAYCPWCGAKVVE